MSAKPGQIRMIPTSKLFVSEPNPVYFGNDRNPPAGQLEAKGWTNENWLKSRFHFSFAEYRSHANPQFGVLRVMNDDLVQPARGFGTHPHRDMEIATYIVSGELTHEDSHSTRGKPQTLPRGSVQYMSAGTGVQHSEHNRDPKNPCRFIQMWVVPRRSGVTPAYGGATFDTADRQDKWCHLVGDALVGDALPAATVRVQQDVNIFSSEVSDGNSLAFDVAEGRQAYILAVEAPESGVAIANDDCAEKPVVLAQHAAAEVYGPKQLSVTGPGHVLIVEMNQDGKGGRTDI